MAPFPIDDPRAPKFWRAEVTGRLEGPIMRYLENKPLSVRDVALIRAYLRQWINSPVWDMTPTQTEEGREELSRLRVLAGMITHRAAIDAWIGLALDLGIDPL